MGEHPGGAGRVVMGALIVATRESGPPQVAWRDVAGDGALPGDARGAGTRGRRVPGAGPGAGGVARATLPDGAPFGCVIAADDPRTGVRAAVRVAEADERRPVRRSGVGFTTWLEDGRLTTLWDEFPVAPRGNGTILLPTSRSAATLYRVHLYRHARAERTVAGPLTHTVAERALGSDTRMIEWYRAHGWLRPHADGSPRFTTRAAMHMVLTYLPPGRWLVYLRNRIAERALLARAGA